MWMNIVNYVSNNTDKITSLILQHITISVVSLLVASLIAIPLGYYCTKSKRRSDWVMRISQTLRLVPSLAVLVLLIPILGTGMLPALIALTLLGIPPILLNTVNAFQSVDEAVLESAYAMGMDEKQVLSTIRIPLSIPMILIGIKISFIEIIASATLASKIGAGGLGDLIFTGLGLNRLELVLIGGVLVALMSIASRIALGFIERRVTKYRYI